MIHIIERTKNSLTIEGTALSAGLTRNNRLYAADVLMKASSTLNDKPVFIDHSVDDFCGLIMFSSWSDSQQAVIFKAKITDENVIELIVKGLIKNVSVGADAKTKKENGVEVVTELKFKELSLLYRQDNAGDSSAKIHSIA